jgi:hypothetical protein
MLKPVAVLTLVLLASSAHARNDLRTARNLARALAKRNGTMSDSLEKTNKNGVSFRATWGTGSSVTTVTTRKDGSTTTRSFTFDFDGTRHHGPTDGLTVNQQNGGKILRIQQHGAAPGFLRASSLDKVAAP